jgi:hypothetical protein
VLLPILPGAFGLNRRDPFWDKYQQVEPGLTQQEVEAILGVPTEEGNLGGIMSEHFCYWKEGEQSIYVAFFDTTRNHRHVWGVIGKRFYPSTGWEYLRFRVERFLRQPDG